MSADTTIEVKPENYFILCTGEGIKDLTELLEKLKTIDDSTFAHHVNENKNDFSNWIRHVFGNHELADTISFFNDREETIKALEDELFTKKKSIISIFKKPRKREQKKTIEPERIEEDAAEEEIAENGEPPVFQDDVNNKIDEILIKEKEIEKREEKIEEIEHQIEQKLESMKKTGNEKKFFSKEFVQGLLIGLLLGLIVALIYVKAFVA